MRYLGIDFGTKKVGLAISDEAGRMGFPHASVPNDGRLIDYVRELIKNKNIQKVVIGESRDFAGNENEIAAKAKAFAVQLERSLTVDAYSNPKLENVEVENFEIAWEPETMTTQQARRDPEGVYTGSHAAVDASAAALILTSYLERTNKAEESTEELSY